MIVEPDHAGGDAKMNRMEERYDILVEELKEDGIDLDLVFEEMKKLRFELPSWGFSDAGTRFAVFHEEGSAQNVFQRVEDAGYVNKVTGLCPTVALHIPWDKVDDWKELVEFAEEKGVKIGAINPNLFQDPDYKYGSLAHVFAPFERSFKDDLLVPSQYVQNVPVEDEFDGEKDEFELSHRVKQPVEI